MDILLFQVEKSELVKLVAVGIPGQTVKIAVYPTSVARLANSMLLALPCIQWNVLDGTQTQSVLPKSLVATGLGNGGIDSHR